ncbi:MAG: hypothetical protein KBC64_02305 [Simkaniaceae bacterium]|nr:hypothetical protein [Simkaniaceae bacterium]
MTLLPFVMTMILVLSLYAASLFKTHSHFVIEKEIYLAQYDGDIAVRNRLVETTYESKKQTQIPRSKHKPPSPKKYPRPTTNFSNKSKLNLSRLNDPIIFKTACELVKRLYKDAPFKVNPTQLLNKVKKKMEKTDDFTELFPYKMVKGTVGNYPPIEDYFYINPKRPAIFFRHASPPIIAAYFGEKIAMKIFELEKESSLTEEQLASLSSKKEGLSFAISKDPRTKETYTTPLTRVERKKKSK